MVRSSLPVQERLAPSTALGEEPTNRYEERITLWQAPSIDEAIAKAEAEAAEYAGIIDDSLGKGHQARRHRCLGHR